MDIIQEYSRNLNMRATIRILRRGKKNPDDIEGGVVNFKVIGRKDSTDPDARMKLAITLGVPLDTYFPPEERVEVCIDWSFRSDRRRPVVLVVHGNVSASAPTQLFRVIEIDARDWKFREVVDVPAAA